VPVVPDSALAVRRARPPRIERQPTRHQLGGDPGLDELAVAQEPRGAWRDSLFSCHRQLTPTCVLAFTVPCLLAGQTAQRVAECHCKSLMSIYVCTATCVTLFCPTFLLGFGGIMCFVGTLNSILSCMISRIRTRVRDVYSIPGSTVLDFVLTFLLQPCVVAQMARHVFGYPKMFHKMHPFSETGGPYYRGGDDDVASAGVVRGALSPHHELPVALTRGVDLSGAAAAQLVQVGTVGDAQTQTGAEAGGGGSEEAV